MNYIDGFVAAVPTAKRAAYLEFARTSAAIWMQMPFDGKRMIYGGFEVVIEA